MSFARRSRSSLESPISQRQGALEADNMRDDAVRQSGRSGGRMGGLVEDLLLLAHLDDGRFNGARAP